jgi:hypothetical protein
MYHKSSKSADRISTQNLEAATDQNRSYNRSSSHEPSISEKDQVKSEIYFDEKQIESVSDPKGASTKQKPARGLKKRSIITQVITSSVMIGIPSLFIGRSFLHGFGPSY